jgi:imidazolonepropionase-like amidohydrolase
MSAMTERAIDAAFNGQEPPPDHQRAAFTRAILESFSDSKCRNVIARLKKNHTWQVPTLGALRSVWGESQLSAEDREYGEKIQQKQFAVVAAMARAEVPLMAGTDGPLSQAGPALHDELQMLVKAGVSSLQAIQAATRNPAEFMGRLPELGTVERGKIADLVLVDADPLLDIANLRRVSTVILGGKVVAPVQP